MTFERILFGPDWTDSQDGQTVGRTLRRLVGPGSLPMALGLMLFAFAAHQFRFAEPGFSGLLLISPFLLAIAIVFAGYRPGPALVLLVSGALSALLGQQEVQDLGFGPPVGPDLVPDRWFTVLVVALIVRVGFRHRYGRVLTTTYTIAVAGLVIGLYGWVISPAFSLRLIVMTLTLSCIIVSLVVGYSARAKSKGKENLAREEKHTAEERGHRQLLEGRAQIAREMHDVVAHHMSVIAVQASTAEYRIKGLSGEARAEFVSIADSARESLTEMRRLLGVLRRADETGERMPQPGIEGIETLVEGAKRAGIDVSVTIPQDLPDLPEAVSLTAYRIVQEALSNVVRHAGGAAARIELYLEDDALVVLVMNDSPRETLGDPPPVDAAGLGLAGMRERVVLLNGELVAEKLGRAGFVVKARLPLEPAPENDGVVLPDEPAPAPMDAEDDRAADVEETRSVEIEDTMPLPVDDTVPLPADRTTGDRTTGDRTAGNRMPGDGV